MNGSSESDQQEYKVNETADFLAAIGSNRTIILEQGRQYNLSKVLGTSQMNEIMTRAGSKISVSENTDGLELYINNVENLTIRGAGDKPVRIVVEPRYVWVLNFLYCRNITIENLEIGHTPDHGYCDGGVLRFTDSGNINVRDCRLFGCGTEGVTISNSTNINIVNTDIYECTYYIFTIRESARIRFDNCRFYDNQEFSLINVSESVDVTMTECMIYDNYGELFNVYSPVVMKGCKISHPKNELGDISNIRQEDCVWNNVAQKQKIEK